MEKILTIEIRNNVDFFLRYNDIEYTFNKKGYTYNLNNYDYEIREKIEIFLENKEIKTNQVNVDGMFDSIFKIYKLNDNDFEYIENLLYCKYKFLIKYNYYGILSHNRTTEIETNKLLTINDIRLHINEIGPKLFKNKKDFYILNLDFINDKKQHFSFINNELELNLNNLDGKEITNYSIFLTNNEEFNLIKEKPIKIKLIK